jgi:iron(III) transport system ATP-binding protein
MVGIMREGRIEQWDTPYNLYHRPATRHVADFIGQGVFLPGEVISRQVVEVELGRLDSDVPMDCGSSCAECQRDCRLDVLLRPDDVIHDDASGVKAEVIAKSFRGAEFLYTLRLASGAQVLSLVPSHHNHAIGEMIGIRLDVDHVVTFTQGR